ncbi:MAG: DUF2098 family protein [Candidatus Methanomethylicaceae archaeon]
MLKEGVIAIYKRTGTLGKVVELREMDGKIWAKLDSTNLFYDQDFLEVLEEKAGTQIDIKELIKEEKKKVRSEELEIKDEGKIDTSGNVCGAG